MDFHFSSELVAMLSNLSRTVPPPPERPGSLGQSAAQIPCKKFKPSITCCLSHCLIGTFSGPISNHWQGFSWTGASVKVRIFRGENVRLSPGITLLCRPRRPPSSGADCIILTAQRLAAAWLQPDEWRIHLGHSSCFHTSNAA